MSSAGECANGIVNSARSVNIDCVQQANVAHVQSSMELPHVVCARAGAWAVFGRVRLLLREGRLSVSVWAAILSLHCEAVGQVWCLLLPLKY